MTVYPGALIYPSLTLYPGGIDMPTTLESIQSKKTQLIRKMTAASLFIAPFSATLPATLTTGASADLVALPAGYVDVGLVTKKDGYGLSKKTEMSETTSHGYVDPTRRDILSVTNTVAYTCQETSKLVLDMFRNVDLSASTGTTVTAEVSFSEALSPTTRYYRALLIGRDGIGANAIYIAQLYPRAMISEFGEQTWNDENELTYPFTLTATPDSTAGYSIKHLFGGLGWKALMVDMGFPSVP
jgi:hypothetical protein